MLRDVFGAIVGIAVAIVTVMLLQKIGHMAFPPPADLDVEDTRSMMDYVRSMPVAALLFVLVSYIFAAFDGTFVACWIGHAKPVIFALIIGVLMLVATISNLIMIPHPLWFSITAVVGIIAAASAAAYMAHAVFPSRLATE